MCGNLRKRFELCVMILFYTTSTVRDICTFAVLCLVTRLFLLLHSCLSRAFDVAL